MSRAFIRYPCPLIFHSGSPPPPPAPGPDCELLVLPDGVLPVPSAVSVLHTPGFEDMSGPSYFNVMEAALVMGARTPPSSEGEGIRGGVPPEGGGGGYPRGGRYP